MQSQRNDIEDDDDVKLPSAHIREIQNTADDRTKVSTEAAIGRRLDVSERNKVQK